MGGRHAQLAPQAGRVSGGPPSFCCGQLLCPLPQHTHPKDPTPCSCLACSWEDGQAVQCWLTAPDRAQAQAAERLTAELRPGVLVHLTQQVRKRDPGVLHMVINDRAASAHGRWPRVGLIFAHQAGVGDEHA